MTLTHSTAFLNDHTYISYMECCSTGQAHKKLIQVVTMAHLLSIDLICLLQQEINTRHSLMEKGEGGEMER